MSIEYREKDLLLTQDFDLYLDPDKGDLALAGYENDLLKEQIIRKRLALDSNDTTLDAIISSNLHDFVGQPLTDSMLEFMQQNVLEVLVFDGIFEIDKVRISHLKYSMRDVFFNIIVEGDRLKDDLSNSYGFTYTTKENTVFQKY